MWLNLLYYGLVLFIYDTQANPCEKHDRFNDDDGNRSPTNLFNSNQRSYCDRTIDLKWYRLKVGKDDANMPTTAPLIGSCNTIYPVWLNGHLPKNPNIPTPVRACAVGGTPCFRSWDIEVMRCDPAAASPFYVYKLAPAALCPSAYCFSSKVKCPDGQSSEDGFQPGCSKNFPNISPVKPVVLPLIGISNWNQFQQEVRFQCTFKNQINEPKLLYDVIWYINDKEVLRRTKKTWTSLPMSAELREHDWKTDFKMGMNVVCALRARDKASRVPSPEHPGDVFFAGIRVLDPTVLMIDGDVKPVRFQLTVPLPCITLLPDCELIVRFDQIGQHTGTRSCDSNTSPSECGISIKASQWNAIQTLFVTAKYDYIQGDRLSQIYLKGTDHGLPGSVWEGVQPQPVQVNVKDKDKEIAGVSCYVRNDPHITTFDKKNFDVQIPGEFVLVRHKSLKVEIRGFFQACRKGTPVPQCVCGVAVRSGTQLFVWSKCEDNKPYQPVKVNIYGCSKNQMRVLVNKEGTGYEIQLPTGMRVVINTRGRVHIFPSHADKGLVTGLCGNFNADKNDEFIDPKGKQHIICENTQAYCRIPTYSKEWRTTDSTLYNQKQLHFFEELTGHCYCTEEQSSSVVKKLTCETVPPKPCASTGKDITGDYCTQLGDGKKTGKKKKVPTATLR